MVKSNKEGDKQAASDADTTDAIGNKKPPKDTQPEQSGNPKDGVSLKMKLENELRKFVNVKLDGKVVKMTKQDVIVHRLVGFWSEGDGSAIHAILSQANTRSFRN